MMQSEIYHFKTKFVKSLMMQETSALWQSFVFIAAKNGIMNTYMKLEPNRVEKTPKTCSCLKKLEKIFGLKKESRKKLFSSPLLNGDDQLDLLLLQRADPVHFVQFQAANLATKKFSRGTKRNGKNLSCFDSSQLTFV